MQSIYIYNTLLNQYKTRHERRVLFNINSAVYLVKSHQRRFLLYCIRLSDLWLSSDDGLVIWINVKNNRPPYSGSHLMFLHRGLELTGSLEYKFLQLEFSIVLSRGLCVDCYSVQDSLWIL